MRRGGCALGSWRRDGGRGELDLGRFFGFGEDGRETLDFFFWRGGEAAAVAVIVGHGGEVRGLVQRWRMWDEVRRSEVGKREQRHGMKFGAEARITERRNADEV